MRLSLIILCLLLWGNVEVSLSQNVTCSGLPNVPHAHVSEETRKAEYLEGNVIHFACETGYISGPTIRYVCTAGGWLPVHKGTCYLKPCVLPDDTPNGYYQIIRGDDFVFGTTIKYYCNEGYHMASKEDTRTCLLDKWTNHVPICDPLSCDPPPEHGQITVTGLPDNDDPILPDRFLTFSCESSGKYLNGSSRLICGKDGQWDHPFPSCEDITCEVGVLHNHLSVAGLPPANETMKIGHLLQFDCNDLYTLDGPKVIECLETGQWNAPLPTCAEKCKVPGVHHSVRIITHVQNNQLRKGQKLRFACRYSTDYLRGKAEVECSANGEWSDPFPTCGGPLGCGKPPPLPDGDTVQSLQFHYNHGETVEYICPSFYRMTGDRRRTCRNGEWIGEMRCLKPCTANKEVMNSHNIRFRYSRDDKLYSYHSQEIEFSCKGWTRHDGRLSMRQTCVDGVMNFPTCH